MIKALAVLQSKGEDVTHSAITADRIVVGTGGRVCVVEHVLGLALRQLNLSASQLWREFGLTSAPTPNGDVQFDARTDVFQLGVLALELLLGRRLSPLDLKDRLPDLLDQWSEAATRAGLASDRLRLWLERALQIGSRSYSNAAEALSDLRDVPSESTASAFDSLPMADVEPIGKRSLQPARPAAGQDAPMANASPSEDFPVVNTPQVAARPAVKPAEGRWADVFPPESKSAALARVRESAPEPGPHPNTPVVPAATKGATPPQARGATGRRTTFKAPRVSPWIAAALGVIALTEGVVIAALLMRQPANAAATVVANSPSPEATRVTTPPPSVAAPAADSKAPPATPAVDQIKAAASAQRSGGLRLVAPFELKVVQGDRVFGSTADGPIIAAAGTYQVELINTAYGYSSRRSLTFRPGQITNLDISIPPGRLSVNAQPWAEISIDGQARGETPLANLSVPVGPHEIVFRHPELGERRQTVTVTARQPSRLGVDMRKK